LELYDNNKNQLQDRDEIGKSIIELKNEVDWLPVIKSGLPNVDESESIQFIIEHGLLEFEKEFLQPVIDKHLKLSSEKFNKNIESATAHEVTPQVESKLRSDPNQYLP